MADTTTAAAKPGDPIRHFVRELTQRAADSSDLELGGIAIALGMVANDVDTIEARIREQVAQEIETHPGPHTYKLLADGEGFWWDTRDRDAAARIARRTA